MTFQQIITSHPLVLVDFHATWCGPCKTMAPILAQLKERVGEVVRIVKIDVDQSPQVANTYQVQGVPTFILFKNGLQVWRQSGVIPLSQFTQFIHQNQ